MVVDGHYTNALSPFAHGPCETMTPAEVEMYLEELIAGLPPELGDALAPVGVFVNTGEMPTDDDGELILGIFAGPDAGERDSLFYLSFSSPTIVIYHRSLRRVLGPRGRGWRELVRDVFLHELGHFVALDEDELEELGV